MRRWIFLSGLALFAFAQVGCGPARAIRATEEDHRAIVAGLEKFLAEHAQSGSSGYRADVQELNIDRNRAVVQVYVRPKDGSSAVTMMRYALHRRGSEWVVMRSRHLNGPILHPQFESGRPVSPSGDAAPPSAGSAASPAKGPVVPSAKKP